MEETLIAADTKVTGVIEGTGGVRIAGWFEGRVLVSGTLLIEHDATVRADCHAGQVVVAGTLEGNVTAQVVEVRSGARLVGEVASPEVSIEEGAVFRGRVRSPTMLAQAQAHAHVRADRALAGPAAPILPGPQPLLRPHRPRPQGRQRIARR